MKKKNMSSRGLTTGSIFQQALSQTWIPQSSRGMTAFIGMTLLSSIAVAQTPVDLSAINHELAGVQSAITTGATNGTLKPEAVQALEGKQKELTDRANKLQTQGHVTTDEVAALQESVAQQEARLKGYSKTRQAARTVDPASLPPPVVEGPYGTVTQGGNNENIVTPTFTGPTTILPNGNTVPAGTISAPGSITTIGPAANVTPGAATTTTAPGATTTTGTSSQGAAR